MRRALPPLIATVLAACASSAPIRWASPSDFSLAVIDNPAHQRFELTLMSKATAPLCLSREAWPDEAALPAGFDGAMLTTNSGQRALLPTGSAYCPGGCGEVQVGPGESIRGAVPYAAFGDPDVIAAEHTRALAFEVHPFVCLR